MESASIQSGREQSVQYKEPGFWLWVGIVILPIICAWALLAPRYRNSHRIIGIGWALILSAVALPAKVFLPLLIVVGAAWWYVASIEKRKPDGEVPPAGRPRINYNQEVVGESNYQSAIRRLARSPKDEVRLEGFTAELIPEPDNPHDRNAVRVLIDGALVGYLPAQDAAKYPRQQGPASCAAIIIGGGTKHFGIWLSR